MSARRPCSRTASGSGGTAGRCVRCPACRAAGERLPDELLALPRDCIAHTRPGCLAAGCPLTLLIDLTDPRGADSKRIMAREHPDMSWLRGLARTTERPTGTVAEHRAG